MPAHTLRVESMWISQGSMNEHSTCDSACHSLDLLYSVPHSTVFAAIYVPLSTSKKETISMTRLLREHKSKNTELSNDLSPKSHPKWETAVPVQSTLFFHKYFDLFCRGIIHGKKSLVYVYHEAT